MKKIGLGLLCLWLVSCGQKPAPPPGPDLVRENNRGVALMGYFDYGKAEAVFQSLVTAYPNQQAVKVNLAIATLNLQTEGSEQRALDLLAQVLAVDSENARALYCSGLLKLYLGDAEAALPYFQKVAALDPADPYAAYYLAQTLVRLGKIAEAPAWYEKAVALDGYLSSAWYGLFQAAQRTGDKARARECLEVFQKLKGNPKAKQVEFKYTRMGAKGEAQTLDAPVKTTQKPDGPLFAAPEALEAPAGHAPNPVAGRTPAVTVADLNGDGVLDLWVAAAFRSGEAVHNGVFFGSAQGFRADPNHPLAAVTDVNAAACGDLDNNGTVDVYLLRKGPNQLWTRSPEGAWTNVTEAAAADGGSGNTVDGVWLDADHDGDLDLFLVQADGPNELLNNNGDGTFRPLGVQTGLAGSGKPSRRVVPVDLDRDRDMDLLIINETPPHEVYLNDRLWAWRRSSDFEALTQRPFLEVVAVDTDADGYFELMTTAPSSGVSHWGRDEKGDWVNLKTLPAGAGSLAVLDVDGDGAVDLVTAGGEGLGVIDLNGGDLFSEPVPLAGAFPLPTMAGQGPALVTVGMDGALKVFDPGPGRYAFTAFSFSGMEDLSQSVRSNAVGIGTTWAARWGSRWSAGVTGRTHGGPGTSVVPVNLGLAGASTLDFIAVTWSDGVFQTELNLATNQYAVITETQRQLSSCPVLFAWDGDRYQFVSDILGVGGMGYAVGPGAYATPRPWENFLLPQNVLEARGETLSLKIAEPMEESCYLDQVALRYYDLPEGWSMVLDERMGTGGPEVTGEPRFYRREVQPVTAQGTDGSDVTDAVLTRDDRAVPLPPLDHRYIGFLAADQTLTLTFADALSEGEGEPLLMIDGWVEYPYSQTNFAAWQAGLSARPPTLEYQNADGSWSVLFETFGYPAGMPRRMSVPLTGLPAGVKSLRLHTNQEIYWDRVSVVFAETPPTVPSGLLPLQAAELRAEGFAKRTTGPQRRPWYDDDARTPIWDTRHQSGDYTALGDVTALLGDRDDALCIFGPGEAVTLTFGSAQPPAAGFTRRYVVESAGWCKDMDLYTRSGETVGPLPGADSAARQRLHPQYQTRLK